MSTALGFYNYNVKFHFLILLIHMHSCCLQIEMTQESNLSKFKSEVESSQVLAYLASDNLFHDCISILEWYSVSSFKIYWLSIVSGVIGKLFSSRSSHNIFNVFPVGPNFRMICDVKTFITSINLASLS